MLGAHLGCSCLVYYYLAVAIGIRTSCDKAVSVALSASHSLQLPVTPQQQQHCAQEVH